jgi:hypothetical protein
MSPNDAASANWARYVFLLFSGSFDLFYTVVISRAPSPSPTYYILVSCPCDVYLHPPTVCLTLHIVCFLAFGDISSVWNSAIATPIPLPLPLTAADRSLSLISVNWTIPHIANRILLSRPYIRTVKPSRHMKEHACRTATSGTPDVRERSQRK